MFSIMDSMITMVDKIRNNKFITYCFFAIITTAINVITYLVFYKFVTNNIIISNIVAYAVSLTAQFIINKNLVFKAGNEKIIIQIIMFLFVKVVSFSIDSAVLILLHDYLKINNAISKLISNASTTISNYYLNEKLVFKNRKEEE